MGGEEARPNLRARLVPAGIRLEATLPTADCAAWLQVATVRWRPTARDLPRRGAGLAASDRTEEVPDGE